uniref:Reverse transcriptase domain-containing protein n=1 Tax=Tanacetum cinerariifolium TaxID=118510 RepID=A0A6L2JCM9_TANCI|nr:reverse transcriptase domain-containing protein [Tanacetum cinerariifolium]
MRYFFTYDDLLVNRIDIIDVSREEYAQEILDFSSNSSGGSLTSTFEPILFNSSPSLTLFEGSDFILKEIEAYLKDDSISPEIDHADFDPEGDICLIEKLLYHDPLQLPPMDPKEVIKAKYLIEEPLEVELKDLPTHLEYAYLEENDNPWVSPIHYVPKKGGTTVVVNEENELIPTRLVTGRRVCIDYWKLNEATRKDHFPLPFMDKMLERLAGNEFYYFLDGFSGYFRIPIDPQDQEKTTFTCPYGTFAYRHMPFGLCNAPGTFQRSMMAIFHDMIEKTIEVFMDDFLVFGDIFDPCLSNLERMLKRPMTHLLEKETSFVFSKDCIDAFETLKKKLTEAPILVSPIGTYLSNLCVMLVILRLMRFWDNTSGQVEVSNHGLKRIFERTVGENRASWSDKLDDALWAFRTAFKTPIGCTPYKLTACDHQKLQLNKLNELRDQAYENSLIYKERTKKLHDSKIKNYIFNIGDRVLLFNSYLKIFSRKLKTRWSGPFTTTKVFPYGTVELSQPDGPNFKVNGHRVKYYFGRNVPKLEWILQESREKSPKPSNNGHKNGKKNGTLAIRVKLDFDPKDEIYRMENEID